LGCATTSALLAPVLETIGISPQDFPDAPDAHVVYRLLYGRDELRRERRGLPVELGVGEQLGAQTDGAAILFNELSGTPAGICCARRGWHPALAEGWP
jgi:hypothetical protein